MRNATTEVIANSPLSLPEKIVWQLQGNHVPPIDPMFTMIAIEAVELASEGEWDTVLSLPNGLTRTVSAVIDLLHLDAFVTTSEEDVE